MIQKPFRGIQLNRTHPLAKGLVGCWLFNEATGETVFDSSSNGNNATIYGADWVGGGLEFISANDDYVSVAHNENLNPNTDLTIISKFYTNSSTQQRIVDKYAITGYSYSYYIKADQTIGAWVYADSTHDNFNTTDTISLGTWQTAALVINSSKAEIFINGTFSADTVLTGSPTPQSANIQFGTRSGAVDTEPLDGKIKHVYIYNRTLSTEEIAWLDREPYAMFEPAFSLGALYAAIPPALKPMWYYDMLRRRNQ